MGRAKGALAAAVLAFALLSSCSSTTVIRQPSARTYAEPTYEDSKEFFLFGLLGPRHSYNTDELCLGKDADQIQTVYADTDVLTGIFTLGIYVPRTMRVWCAL